MDWLIHPQVELHATGWLAILIIILIALSGLQTVVEWSAWIKGKLRQARH